MFTINKITNILLIAPIDSGEKLLNLTVFTKIIGQKIRLEKAFT